MNYLRLYAFSLLVTIAACGPSTSGGGPCDIGETSCDGNTFLICSDDGTFVESATCTGTQVCTDNGCEDIPECTPGNNVCVGNSVYLCGTDGSPDSLVETCSDICANGQCVDNSGCTNGAGEFVYVVDDSNTLYAFDPANDAHTFTTIGTLNCNAGSPLGGFPGPATPFSMSVDRDAVAWVLYSSGELFHVSTENASCSATTFTPQQQQYDLFGMGFVADAAGSDSEKLYVTGSTINSVTGELENTKIGYIEKSTLQVTHLQNMANRENPPELTGTGDAKLYGYFPGASSTIEGIDKATGSSISSEIWGAGSLGGQTLRAWAFAQWGGRFYVFVTTSDALGISTESKVVRVDPAANGGAGDAVTVKDTGVPIIVGAGVSTCAPVVID